MRDCDLGVSISETLLGYGGKGSMGENLDKMARMHRHGRLVGKSGSEKKDRVADRKKEIWLGTEP
jgi:hypothetical protein